MLGLSREPSRWDLLLRGVPDFGDPRNFAGLFFLENIYKIIGHFFLCNNNLLPALDDEVPAFVVLALARSDPFFLVHVDQCTVEALDHRGDVAQEQVLGIFIRLYFFFLRLVVYFYNFFSDIHEA